MAEGPPRSFFAMESDAMLRRNALDEVGKAWGWKSCDEHLPDTRRLAVHL